MRKQLRSTWPGVILRGGVVQRGEASVPLGTGAGRGEEDSRCLWGARGTAHFTGGQRLVWGEKVQADNPPTTGSVEKAGNPNSCLLALGL